MLCIRFRRPKAYCGVCFAIALLLLCPEIAGAGMPSPIPVFDGPGESAGRASERVAASSSVERHLQAVSFFVACLLGLAAAVKGLWNALRQEMPAMPRISYGRALSFVVLWGLLFVVVLTMISGARELMTPGAWRKQGWTYKLTDAAEPAAIGDTGGIEERRAALERLRTELLVRAAQNGGRFPTADAIGHGAGIDPVLWELPRWPGLSFLYVAGQNIDPAGRLLVYEPQVAGAERLVLLTNGAIATMSSADIERIVAATPSLEVAAP